MPAGRAARGPAHQRHRQRRRQSPARAVSGPTYTVQPGDSLWSIAARLLGPDAASAAIADEVRRLWALNERRIGTGDPDLLIAGTALELR